MAESTLPTEIWIQILMFSDYDSNYFQLYCTSKFFKQILDSILFTYLQTNYSEFCLSNLVKQIPFYEQHFSTPDKPWLKKLLFFYYKHAHSLPQSFDITATLSNPFFETNPPTITEYAPLQYGTGSNRIEQDVNIKSSAPFCIANSLLQYFEIEILSASNGCSIGLAHKNYNYLLQPGWRHCSIGYHADDGGIFVEKGFPSAVFSNYTTGDVVGCGVMTLKTKETVVFFTKNGQVFSELIPIKVISKQLNLFPTIGLWGSYILIKANLGHQPFVFENWISLNQISTIRSDCRVSDFMIHIEDEIDLEEEEEEEMDDEEEDEEWTQSTFSSEEEIDEEMEELE